MSDKSSIANLALQLLGETPDIVDVDTDDTKHANEIKAAWDATLDAALAEHPWRFALVRAAWPASATAPAWGFARAYPFAADPYCLDVVRLDPLRHGDLPGTWDVVGREVHADEDPPLYVEYIARVTDPARFHPMFVEFFAAKLAEKIAFRVTGKANLAPDMREYRKELQRDARWKSAVASGRSSARDGDFLSSRSVP